MGAFRRVERFETLQRIGKKADLRNAQMLPGNIEHPGEVKEHKLKHTLAHAGIGQLYVVVVRSPVGKKADSLLEPRMTYDSSFFLGLQQSSITTFC